MERSSFQSIRGSQAYFFWRRRYWDSEADNEFTSGVVFDGLGVTKNDSGVIVAAGDALVHGFPYRSDGGVVFAIPVPTTGTAAVNLTDIVTAGFLAFASLQATHVTVGVRPIGTMLYLDWRTVDGSTRTTLDIHWMTIGPE